MPVPPLILGDEKNAPRRPSPALGLGVLAVTTLVVLGACELGLRLAGYDPIGRIADEDRFMIQASPDPELVYELAPNTKGFVWDAQVQINSHGFRDEEVTLEKPAGTTRVVALGDSVTFGPGLDAEERWTEVLEDRWSNRGIAAEVLNLGVVGYDVAQEVAQFERLGLPFAPDEVMMCYCINDVDTVSFDLGAIETLQRFNAGVLGWSRAAQWVTLKLDAMRRVGTPAEQREAVLRQRAKAVLVDDVELDALIAELEAALERAGTPKEYKDRSFRGRLALYTDPLRLQRVRSAYARLAELSEAHDFEVTVFVAPVLWEGLDAEGWAIAYRMVQHLAESAGFQFVDVHPELSTGDLLDWRFKGNDYVHLNAEAHREISRIVARETRARFERSTGPGPAGGAARPIEASAPKD